MAKPQHIVPFPADIDRDHFGSWFSGFTDGEASFTLAWAGKEMQQATISFKIQLRDDDRHILYLIQSYLQAGHIRFYDRYATAPKLQRSVASYSIQSAHDLYEVLLPHFARYPLLAKKRGDFEIWKQAVEFLHRITGRRGRNRPAQGGSGVKWQWGEREEFDRLRLSLKENRRYTSLPSAPDLSKRPEKPLPAIVQKGLSFD